MQVKPLIEGVDYLSEAKRNGRDHGTANKRRRKSENKNDENQPPETQQQQQQQQSSAELHSKNSSKSEVKAARFISKGE